MASDSKRPAGAESIAAYDPATAPDAQQWSTLDEEARVFLVSAWHKKARQLPGEKHPATLNLRLHALGHVLVENMLASDQAVATQTVATLTSAGLSRHESIHALIDAATACMLNLAICGEEYSDEQLQREIARVDKNHYFDTAPDALDR